MPRRAAGPCWPRSSICRSARQLGGNAVVNIVSYYKKSTSASSTDYVCHAGNFVAGVALKGTVVTTGR